MLFEWKLYSSIFPAKNTSKTDIVLAYTFDENSLDGFKVQAISNLQETTFTFCYVPATSAASSNGIFAAATNSSNQTNKAGGTSH